MPYSRSDAERRRILAQWRRSGSSSHEFAACSGVSHATLYKWRRELGALRRSAPVSFVELALTDPSGDTSSVDAARVEGASGVELLLPHGVRLHLACGFDADTLRRAVETLGALHGTASDR